MILIRALGRLKSNCLKLLLNFMSSVMGISLSAHDWRKSSKFILAEQPLDLRDFIFYNRTLPIIPIRHAWVQATDLLWVTSETKINEFIEGCGTVGFKKKLKTQTSPWMEKHGSFGDLMAQLLEKSFKVKMSRCQDKRASHLNILRIFL